MSRSLRRFFVCPRSDATTFASFMASLETRRTPISSSLDTRRAREVGREPPGREAGAPASASCGCTSSLTAAIVSFSTGVMATATITREVEQWTSQRMHARSTAQVERNCVSVRLNDDLAALVGSSMDARVAGRHIAFVQG